MKTPGRWLELPFSRLKTFNTGAQQKESNHLATLYAREKNIRPHHMTILVKTMQVKKYALVMVMPP